MLAWLSIFVLSIEEQWSTLLASIALVFLEAFSGNSCFYTLNAYALETPKLYYCQLVTELLTML